MVTTISPLNKGEINVNFFDKFKKKPKKENSFSECDEHASDFTPDCPAITALKESNQLEDDLSISYEWWDLYDFCNKIGLEKDKPKKYEVTVSIEKDKVNIRFNDKHNTALFIDDQLTVDWE